ncbi:MAG: hypothetical protein IT372_18220, partial [Polyangiaceae bacterium]|nr:hypothetical protein [Polyangiaceae bacterium]
MRTRKRLLGMVGLLATAAAGYAGCGTAHDDIYKPLTEGPGGTGGGGGGGMPAGCIPSENADPVGDCGVFVSSSLGDDENDGSKTTPVRTLGKALTLAGFGDRRVYACAEQFDEAIQVLPGIAIYGGL